MRSKYRHVIARLIPELRERPEDLGLIAAREGFTVAGLMWELAHALDEFDFAEIVTKREDYRRGGPRI